MTPRSAFMPANTIRLTGAQLLVRGLQAEGVQHAFGIVGGKLGPPLKALADSPIRWTGVRHEAAGPVMAAAVFARSGAVALAVGEMGPGGLNLAAGAGVAANNHLAALLVTTNQHRAAAYPHSGMFMDLATRALLAPLVKWNAVVHNVRRLPELLRTALRQALSGRPGPVHLDIPQDVLAGQIDWPADDLHVPPARDRPLHAPRANAQALQQAAVLPAGARQPLIVAGGGVVAADGVAALQAVAARLRSPVAPTQMALGAVPSSSAHWIGHGGLIAGPATQRAFAEADVVLAVGCRFSSWLWDEHGPLVRRQQALININIDPAALGAPALHHVALQADAREALTDLLMALQPLQPQADAAWLPALHAQHVAHLQQMRATAAADTDPVMHPAALADAIGRALPDDALVVYDGGHTSFWSNDLTPVHAPRTRFHDPGMCQLGGGLPWALALQRLEPGRPVFNLTGDGSFGFTLQELDTARREGLPVVTVIHDNAAWGIIRAGQQRAGFSLGTVLEGTDDAAIARGFGCHGETVRTAAEVAPALVRALASGLPAVLDCRTRCVPHPAGQAFGSMNRYGFCTPAA